MTTSFCTTSAVCRKTSELQREAAASWEARSLERTAAEENRRKILHRKNLRLFNDFQRQKGSLKTTLADNEESFLEFSNLLASNSLAFQRFVANFICISPVFSSSLQGQFFKLITGHLVTTTIWSGNSSSHRSDSSGALESTVYLHRILGNYDPVILHGKGIVFKLFLNFFRCPKLLYLLFATVSSII